MMEDYARKRARVAWADVEKAFECFAKKEKEEFRQWLKKVPAMVKTNGLAETMAFLYSKKGVQREIYKMIGCWVIRKSVYASYFAPDMSHDQWLGGLLRQTSSVYRMVTVDVLAYVEWARRFAEGMQGVGTQEEKCHDA